MTNVGKNIRLLRVKSGLTQDELADKLFVSRQTISNYETGKSHPDIDILVKLAELLGTDANTLIYGIPTPPERKKEYKRFIIAFVITALLFAALLIFRPIIKEYQNLYYDLGPSIVFISIFKPCFYGALGFLIMQAACAFFGAKPLRGKAVPTVRWVVIGLIILYFVSIAPEIFSLIRCTIIAQQLITAHQCFSGEDLPSLYIPVWSDLGQFLLYRVIYKWAPVFVIPSALLWATQRQK